jgi:hypothetical protein
MPQAAGAATALPWTELIGVWIAAFLTLAIFSFLYRDNPVYKLAEHIFVGISAGYGVVIVYQESVVPDLVNPLLHPEKVGLHEPNLLVLIPGALGMLMFSRFLPRYDWLSRWPIAFIMGLYSGVAIPITIKMNLVKQTGGTMQPVLPTMSEAARWHTFSDFVLGFWPFFGNLLLIVGVICTLAYFYFSRPHRGAMGVASRIGIFFLMVAFGAGFGNTVMARVSLLIGRVQFLYFEWWQPHVYEPILGLLQHLGGG